nr:PREDICTED: aminopeptidase N-like [Linepithema humile]
MTSKTRVGMGYLKVILLVNIWLTFAIETTNSMNPDIIETIPDQQQDKNVTYLSTTAYPKHYNVVLGVNTKAYPIISLKGRLYINITVVPDATIKTFYLHGKNIIIDDYYTTLSNSKVIHFVDRSYTIDEFLVIKFTTRVFPGDYVLKILFESTAANYSFFRNELPTEHVMFGLKNDLLMKQFKKTATRYLFPCWDDPAYKTTFNIHVKHEAAYTLLSNMPISEIYDANDAETYMKWTKFEITPMISTYQLMLLFKPFDILVDPRETVYTWLKSERQSILSLFHSTVDNVTKNLVEYTNISLGEQEIHHVIVPNAPHSEANLGLIIYRESDVKYDENKDLISVKMDAVNVIESQIAHLWFGSLVTPKSWNHLWLTESFALYFSHYSIYKAELCENKPDCNSAYLKKAAQLKLVENYYDIMRRDDGSMPPVVSEINNPSDIVSEALLRPTSDAYHKGAFILRMLSSMYAQQFQDVIITYLKKYKYRSVTTDDLNSVLREWEYVVSAHSHYTLRQKHVDIGELVDSWTKQKGFPVLWAERNYETNFVTISQHAYYKNQDVGSNWTIPVTYMTSASRPYVSNQYWIFWWLTPTTRIEFQMPADTSWYLVNVQQVGYYRVHYDLKNWRNLGHYLQKSDSIAKIHVLNRAQLIDDICDNFQKK